MPSGPNDGSTKNRSQTISGQPDDTEPKLVDGSYDVDEPGDVNRLLDVALDRGGILSVDENAVPRESQKEDRGLMWEGNSEASSS
jgi:hypothetical protein